MLGHYGIIELDTMVAREDLVSLEEIFI